MLLGSAGFADDYDGLHFLGLGIFRLLTRILGRDFFQRGLSLYLSPCALCFFDIRYAH